MNIKNLRKNKKGFTLIEIIVVVVILAVLMAVAVPSVLKYINEADNAKYMAQGRAVMSTAQAEIVKAYVGDKKIDSTELANIKKGGTYNDNAGGLETVAEVEIYKSGTVSQSGDVITIATGEAFVADSSATNTVPELKIVFAKIGGKFVVATPNGKIYVSAARPVGAPAEPAPAS